MAVINNLNSAQTPIASGRTGKQVIRFIDCPRFYLKAKDVTAAPLTAKSDGTLPSGYTDLGIVVGKAKVSYTKEIKEIRTGVDQVLRQSYVGQKTGTLEATLGQFDDVVLEQVSGITPSVITAGSGVVYGIGSEDIIEKAMVLVSQNKADGKEAQFYSPNAFLSFTIEDDGDATVLKAHADLPFFTWNGKENVVAVSFWNVNA